MSSYCPDTYHAMGLKLLEMFVLSGQMYMP